MFLYISFNDVTARLPRENALFHVLRNVGRKQTSDDEIFSLSKLECGPQEINSGEIRLH